MNRSDFKVQGNSDCRISSTWALKSSANHELVKDFCLAHNLEICEEMPGHLRVEGTSADMGSAFGTHIMNWEAREYPGMIYQAPDVEPCIPPSIVDHVEDVIGMDNIPYLAPRHLLPRTTKKTSYRHNPQLFRAIPNLSSPYFTAPQVANLYDFPAGSGKGQTIAIISLGGGYRDSDVTTYFQMLGIPVPSVSWVSVNGGQNRPDNSAASLENALDIQIAAAVAPEAKIRVYIAPNSFQGFYSAILRATFDNVSAISISWGAPEARWPRSTLNAYNYLFYYADVTRKITITAASGDRGSSDGLAGLNVDFPAASPFVLACGGTRLQGSGSIVSEVVWNNDPATSATGGGVSDYFSAPSFQNSLDFRNRALPDVCGNADPETGYVIYMDGQTRVVGGTSAVSPLWAGLVARINTISQKKIGAFHAILYENPSVCRDIILGNNGFYSASRGWDACSGIGSPKGAEILTLFVEKEEEEALAPVAAFSASPTRGVAPLRVSFTDESSEAPTSWSWRINNTVVSTAQHFTHIFEDVGTFSVSLVVGNHAGTSISTKTILVTGSPPIAKFSYKNLQVTFQNSSSGATSWLWNFGDGQTSTLENPVHQYSRGGSYRVSLIATNSNGSHQIVREIHLE